MISKLKKTAGFTLIELIIYISILSVITVVVANSFLILNRGRAGVEAKSELNSNLRFVTEKIKRDIASSSSLITPDSATISAGASTTALKLLMVDNLSLASSTVEYLVSNNRVKRQIKSQPSNTIISDEYISSDKIKIQAGDLYFFGLENTNSILNIKRISVEINLRGTYNSSSSDWQYTQSDQTSADINKDN
jgi:prepilin-type N-terminal cleavage/methylation domain-containing protein